MKLWWISDRIVHDEVGLLYLGFGYAGLDETSRSREWCSSGLYACSKRLKLLVSFVLCMLEMQFCSG